MKMINLDLSIRVALRGRVATVGSRQGIIRFLILFETPNELE